MAILIERNVLDRKVMEKPEIRQSLVRRIMSFMAERRRLEARIAILTELEKELQDVVRELDQRGQHTSLLKTEPDTLVPSLDGYDNASIKELLQKALKSGPMELAELVQAAHAAKVNFGEKAPARVVHFNLLNLKNAGLIARENDKWRLIERS
jgi:hypothetical protein